VTGSISLKLLETNRQIQDKIYKAIAEEVNSSIIKNKKKTTEKLRAAIKTWVYGQPELSSLLANGVPGSLSAQFGIPAGTSDGIINQIVDAVSKAITIDIKPFKKNLKGNLQFNFQTKDFQNLLTLPEGHVVTEKGADLHWLNWLLQEGDKTIVVGYNYIAGPLGRSGGGEMNIGGIWRVPPEFSGTSDNNFITRSFDGKESEISNILKGLFL